MTTGPADTSSSALSPSSCALVLTSPLGRLAVLGESTAFWNEQLFLVQSVLAGWQIDLSSDPDCLIQADLGTVTLHRTAKGWQLLATHLAQPPLEAAHPLELANGLAGLISASYVARTPETLQLHAGAVATPRGLLLLLGPTHAGKSFLSLHLATQKAVSFWGDDRLILHKIPDSTEFEAIALGMTAKLREPLPPDCPSSFRSFAEKQGRSVSESLRLIWPEQAAASGTTSCRFAGLLSLQRQSGVSSKAELKPLSQAQIIQRLIKNSFAPQLQGPTLITFLKLFAASLPVEELIYTDAWQTQTLLTRRFF